MKGFVRKIVFFPLTAAALVLAGVSPERSGTASADPLGIILNSRQLKSYQSRSKSTLKRPRWFVNTDKLFELFSMEGGALYLIEWLSFPPGDFTQGAETDASMPEYLAVSRVYNTKKLEQLKLDVFVPHPKYTETAEAGLMAPFDELMPPKLRSNKREEFEFHGCKATLYDRVPDGYTLVIHAHQHAFIVIRTEQNTLRQEVLDLAEKLALEKFNEEIDS